MKEEELCYIPQTLRWDPWRVRLCDWRQTEIDKTLKVRNPALTLSTGMRSSTVPIPSLSSPWICLINHKPGRDPPRLLSKKKPALRLPPGPVARSLLAHPLWEKPVAEKKTCYLEITMSQWGFEEFQVQVDCWVGARKRNVRCAWGILRNLAWRKARTGIGCSLFCFWKEKKAQWSFSRRDMTELGLCFMKINPAIRLVWTAHRCRQTRWKAILIIQSRVNKGVN